MNDSPHRRWHSVIDDRRVVCENHSGPCAKKATGKFWDPDDSDSAVPIRGAFDRLKIVLPSSVEIRTVGDSVEIRPKPGDVVTFVLPCEIGGLSAVVSGLYSVHMMTGVSFELESSCLATQFVPFDPAEDGFNL